MNNIQLTEEELKFYEVKNPIQIALEKNDNNKFKNAVNTIKKAIEKDKDRDFDEAIELYNRGIDLVMAYMKDINNGNERFFIAKKIDIYTKRVNYLNNCRQNELLIKDIKL